MKKNNNKGFTLMEMLIVVAIIAILIAIAIPTFTNSLNKAKDAADEANGRALYAALSTALLLNENVQAPDEAKSIEFQGTTYTFNTAPTTVDIVEEDGIKTAKVVLQLSDGKTVTFPGGVASGSTT